MSDFKGRHFRGEIVLWAVRWYCRYPISYRDLEAMMTERGVAVDHSTIYRWVQRFAPEMEKRLRWQWRRPQSRSGASTRRAGRFRGAARGRGCALRGLRMRCAAGGFGERLVVLRKHDGDDRLAGVAGADRDDREVLARMVHAVAQILADVAYKNAHADAVAVACGPGVVARHVQDVPQAAGFVLETAIALGEGDRGGSRRCG